jgi:hypothetical protein
MLKREQIAAIHIAKSEGGLSDSAYRVILREAAGVMSSTAPELGDKEFRAIMARLRDVQPDRRGWKQRQVRKWKQYVKFCGMDLVEARALLLKAGIGPHEESPELGQEEFEDAMCVIEEELERRTPDGRAKLPKGLKINYWRSRKPGHGMCTTREVHKIRTLFLELQDYLDEERKTEGYLWGMVLKSCGLKKLKSLFDLKSWQALNVIEALKERIAQEKEKLSEEVPF